MDAAREWAASIAWSAPLAMQSVKEVQREIECVPLQQAFEEDAHRRCRPIAGCSNPKTRRKAYAAFVEKREPGSGAI
jgi:crotonobetainyl-CoA hydratase